MDASVTLFKQDLEAAPPCWGVDYFELPVCTGVLCVLAFPPPSIVENLGPEGFGCGDGHAQLYNQHMSSTLLSNPPPGVQASRATRSAAGRLRQLHVFSIKI